MLPIHWRKLCLCELYNAVQLVRTSGCNLQTAYNLWTTMDIEIEWMIEVPWLRIPLLSRNLFQLDAPQNRPSSYVRVESTHWSGQQGYKQSLRREDVRHRSVGSTIRMLFKQIFTNSRVGFAAGEDHLRYKGCRNAERDTKYQSRGENSPRANGDLASLEKQFISLQGIPECTEYWGPL